MLFCYINSIFFNPRIYFVNIYYILRIIFGMFLLGFRRKFTALALCKSIETAVSDAP